MLRRKIHGVVVRFLKKEDGPTAVEYAVMLALIVVVCIAAVQTLGTNSSSTFSNVTEKGLKAGSSGGGSGSGGGSDPAPPPEEPSM